MFAAFSYDKEARTLASQRPWSKSGVVPFTDKDGNPRYIFATSINGDPPNVEVGMGPNADPDLDYAFLGLFNPVLLTSGNCGNNANSFPRSGQCRFDYPATVDLTPEAERTNLFLSGQMKMGSNFRLFGEALLSDASVKAGFAAPAQPMDLTIGSPLYNTYVLPNLASQGIAPTDVGYANYYMRLADAGQRRDDYQSKGSHFVLGLDGTLRDFDVSGTYTHSQTDLVSKTIGGYVSRSQMNALIAAEKWDPFAQGTDASRAAIAPAILNVDQGNVRSSLDVLSLRASGSVWKLAARDVMLGTGIDLTKQSYADTPDPIFQGPNAISPNVTDFPIGASQGSTPFDASRNSYGAFTELLVPVTSKLEVSGAVRYDSFNAVENQIIYKDINTLLPPGEQGNKADKATYKMSLRFQPTREVMVRGSVGTGFRAPTLNDVAAPLSEFGVIGTQRDCPVTSGDPLFAGCRSVPTQYTLYRGGNSFTGIDGLKPETSDQWTLGARWEPAATMTLGVDLWSVNVKNAITEVPEDTAFDNFANYRGLFSLTTDTATGRQILTFNQVSVNSAVRAAKGLDWDFTMRNKFDFGALTTRFNGTYLIDSYFDLGFGGGKETSLGKLGSDDQVAFRVITRLAATLDTGIFSNTLALNWRSGYTDQSYSAGDGTIFVRNADGSRGSPVAYEGHEVPSYSTVDWQGVIRPMKNFSITMGIKNLLDQEPPLSVKTVAGNQVGVDSRYHDVIGRTFYLQGNYKF